MRLLVKEVAESKGVNPTELSHRSRVSLALLYRIWRNPNKSITTDTLQRIADALDCSITDLITDNGKGKGRDRLRYSFDGLAA